MIILKLSFLFQVNTQLILSPQTENIGSHTAPMLLFQLRYFIYSNRYTKAFEPFQYSHCSDKLETSCRQYLFVSLTGQLLYPRRKKYMNELYTVMNSYIYCFIKQKYSKSLTFMILKKKYKTRHIYLGSKFLLGNTDSVNHCNNYRIKLF